MTTTTEASQPDVIGAVAKTVTGTGAAVAALGGLTLTEWMGVIGVLIALLGAIANWWHNRYLRKLAEREDARQQEEHEMRVTEHHARLHQIRQGVADRRTQDVPVVVERRKAAHQYASSASASSSESSRPMNSVEAVAFSHTHPSHFSFEPFCLSSDSNGWSSSDSSGACSDSGSSGGD